MSDDQWRRNQDDDFGPPLFGDEPTNEHEVLSFDDDSGAMPHWTEPATGQVPRSEYSLPETIVTDETDDLDVWSSFSAQADPTGGSGIDRAAEPSATMQVPVVGGYDDDIAGLTPLFGGDDTGTGPIPVSRDGSGSITRETGRITIGTDATDGAMQRSEEHTSELQ